MFVWKCSHAIFPFLFVSGQLSFSPLLNFENAEAGHVLQLLEAVAVQQEAEINIIGQLKKDAILLGQQEAALDVL